jgi:hypothetical protein
MAGQQDPSLQTFDPIQIPRRRDFIPVDDMVDQVRPPDLSKYPNPMLQLADALKTVNPVLGQLTDVTAKRESQADKMAGRDAAIKSGLAWQEGVKRGLVPANASPWFQAAYKEQSGRIMGDQLYAKGMSQYANWSGRDSDNPNDFQSFMNNFRQQATQGVNDPYVMEGLAPKLEQVTGQLTDHHVAYTAERQQNTMLTGMGTELTSMINTEYQKAHMTGQAVDYDNIWAALQRVKENPLYVGIPGAKVNAAVADAFSNAIHETGDMKLGNVTARPNADGSPGFGLIPQFRKSIDDANNFVFQKKMALDDHMRTQQLFEQNQASNHVLGDAINALHNGQAPDWHALASIEGFKPGATLQVQQYQQFLKEQVQHDGSNFFQKWGDVFSGHVTPMQLTARITQDHTLSTEQATMLMNYTITGRANKGAFANPGVQGIYTKTFSDLNAPMTKLFGTHSADASSAFYQDMMQWDDNNPSASPVEQIKHAQEVSDTLVSVYNKGDGASQTMDDGFTITKPSDAASAPATPAPAATNENPNLPPFLDPKNSAKVQTDLAATKSGRHTPQDFDAAWGKGAYEQLSNPNPTQNQ